jgi:phosphoribosylformylglycinamidine cyclo-ligase
VDLDAFRVPPVFRAIRDAGGVGDEDMLSTFNMGVGMALVARESDAERICGHLASEGCDAWPIGRIEPGEGGVDYTGRLRWP